MAVSFDIKIFKSKYFWLVLIFAIFILIRLPGLDLSYYQDERVWPDIGSAGIQGLGGFLHPPLTSLIFIAAVKIFGADNLRYLPFLFSIVNFWLLFLLVRSRFSLKTAFWRVLFLSKRVV